MKHSILFLTLALALGLGGAATGLAMPQSAAAANCRPFPETGYQVCGTFLAYWQDHGGLAQQGYPVSPPFTETSTVDGKSYQVQYFERAVFELHPENTPPNTVLLSLVGRDALQLGYPNGVPAATATPLPAPLTGNCADFPLTGQQTCGLFRTYWEAHGGLAQQGYPLTGIFSEKSAVDGQTYLVQYFERAVFEYHPEQDAASQVLLSQLGRLRYVARYPDGPPTIDTEFVSLSHITIKSVSNNYVTWSMNVTNTSAQPLLSVLITIAFYDANGNQIDTSIAGATNLNPGETHPAQGLSVKGLGYASYRILTPDVLVKP
ncbi:MAG: FxLYD domain-containing protein [Thermomicrobiales bacterium]